MVSVNSGVSSTCYLATGEALSVTSTGTISGINTAVIINLGATATSVTNSGFITGNSNGINVWSGSTLSGGITNQTGGTISGSNAGISLTSGSSVGSVTNSGTISGNYAGIMLRSSSSVGGIVNDGTISGAGYAGIVIASSSSITGGITNNGTISGASGISLFGSTVDQITNNANGTISGIGGGCCGGSDGIGIHNGSSVGSITNSGIISANTSGSAAGINVSSSTITGGITNQTGGTISANSASSGQAIGIKVGNSSTITGGITNNGTISASASSGQAIGINVGNSSTITGGITNNAGGTISANNTNGTAAGINIAWGSTVNGGISNSGTISGSSAGIRVQSRGTINGGISNSGTINGGTINGGISNSGTINGGISNSGTITGDISNKLGGLISGVLDIQGPTNVTNDGTIALSANAPSTIGGNFTQSANGLLQVNSSNPLTVAGTATLDGTLSAILNPADFTLFTHTGPNTIGGIVNAGTLSGNFANVTDNSVMYDFTSVVNGKNIDLLAAATTNTCAGVGTVTGAQTGPCEVGFDAPNLTVTGTGSISGAPVGIQVLGGSYSGSVTIDAGGGVSGSSTGVLVSNGVHLTGNISNSGTISGSNAGISLNSGSAVTGAITNQAGGTISGYYGISLSNGSSVGSVTNSGKISGSSAGISLSNGSSVGSVTNSGTISGYYGISLGRSSAVTGAITNQAGGTITGSYAGISLTSGSSVGSVTNSGTISGNNAGISLRWNSAVTGVITNQAGGTISGSSDGISLSRSSVGGIVNNGTISGNNAGIMLSSSSSVVGGIVNDGNISGVSGISLNGSAVDQITNNANGTITASASSGRAIGINVGNSSTITGGISNNGTISASASSSGQAIGINVGNSSTITGGITNNGTISASASGNSAAAINIESGASVGNITNNGTISANNTNGSAAGINIMGSTVAGDIINNSNSTISASASSGWAAAINIDSGSTVGNITNNGTLSASGNKSVSTLFVGGNSTVGNITNNGTISASGSGTSVAAVLITGGATVANLSNTGSILGGAGTGVHISSSSTVTGGISNSGTISGGAYAINVDSSSILPNIDIIGAAAHLIGNVSAPNTALNITSGANFTSQGAFDVGSFNIANTATFNMANDVITPGFNNSGTLAVAAGTTSTITGNYTQAAGGVFQTGLSGNATNYGKLVVTGTADLSASNKLAVDVAGTPTLAIGDVMHGVISAGTLKAGPTYTVTDNSALFNFTAATNGNAVDLTVQRGLTASGSVANTGKSSALGAAGVIDTLLSGGASGDMGTVVTALGKLATEKEVATAVSETLPLMTGGLTQLAASNLDGVNRIVESRQGASSGMSSGDGFIGNGRGWIKPLGSWAKQDNSDAAYGYKAQTSGVVLGADSERGESSRIGAAFAYTNSNVDSNDSAQHANVDSYQAVLYGNISLNQNYEVNWQADYGYNKNTGSRDISFVNRTASSDYSSSSVHVGTGVAHSMQLSGQTRFIPSIRADYTSITDKAYTETGAGALNLAVNGRTTNAFIIEASGKVSHSLDDTSNVSANLGVGYDTLAKQNSITAAFQGGGAAFTTVGIKPSSTLVRAGLGYAKSTAGGIDIMARYDIEARSGFTAQTVSVKFRKAF